MKSVLISVFLFSLLFLSAAVASEQSDPNWRESLEIEKLILKDGIDEAVRRLDALPDRKLASVYLAIIKSYEFVPNSYDPLGAVEGLKSFLKRSLIAASPTRSGFMCLTGLMVLSGVGAIFWAAP